MLVAIAVINFAGMAAAVAASKSDHYRRAEAEPVAVVTYKTVEYAKK